MKLSEKITALEEEAGPAAMTPGTGRGRGAARRPGPAGDRRRRVRARVLEEVAPTPGDGNGGTGGTGAANGAGIRRKVGKTLDRVVEEERAQLSPTARRALVDEMTSDLLGFGPLDAFLTDSSVNEVMCNAHDEVWVEREGRIERTDAAFADEEHYRSVIERIVAGVGRRLDEGSPMVDARLPDGSRVNVIIPPLTRREPALTLRRFRPEPFTVKDLVNLGTLPLDLALFLEACVRGRLNVVISGGTGSGKTTMLNVLSGFVPESERVVTVEDVFELQLAQPHVVALEARPPNAEGRGEVTIRDLVRNALRMRPDRIVVGECRGSEALDMLQAMNTGHEGSLTTVHANSTRDSLSRLETMVLLAGFDLPVRAIREQIAAAVDLVVHQGRLRNGARRVLEVAEIHGMEGDTLVLQELFAYDYRRDRLEGNGLRPHVLDKLEAHGVDVPPPWGTGGPPEPGTGRPTARPRRKRDGRR